MSSLSDVCINVFELNEKLSIEEESGGQGCSIHNFLQEQSVV